MNSNGYPISGIGGEDGVTTDDVVSLDDTSKIELGSGVINFLAPSVQIAGVPIIDINSGVSNPMLADLDCNGFNLTDVGEINGANISLLQTNIATLNTKTFYINTPLSLNGTIFDNNIYSDGFIKNGGTNQQYLMADGSALQYSANSGNSNFYLYTSSQTITISPGAGQITYNNANQSLATVVYISHITRDNIDIEVYFKQLSTLNEVYIQDQNLSENFIQYNITGTPTITVNNKVAIPVQVRISGGDGALTFGPNHPVLISFFTNAVEADIRISAVEGKTQNITSNTTTNNINRSLNMLITSSDAVAIRSTDLLTNYAIWSSLGFEFYRSLNMNARPITNVSSISISSGLGSEFLKADGTLDGTAYATASGLSGYLPLIGGTMSGNLVMGNNNINGVNELYATSVVGGEIITNTIYDQSYTNSINLTPTYITLNAPRVDLFGPIDMFNHSITNISTASILGAGDVFTVKNSSSADLFKINQTAIQCSATINMNSNKITALGEPTDAKDAGTKNYIDTANNLKLSLAGGTMTGALLMNNNNISGVGNFTLFNSTSNGIAYFGGGFLANANKDFFIQIGGTSIQAMITQISLSAGNTIRLSSGEWTENVTCFNQNYTICGAPCAMYNQMTQIVGNFNIGSTLASSIQTRIRLKDLKIIGNLVFNNDAVYQQLRTYIDNCDISGTITFPTSVVNTSGLGIYFTNCSFSGSNNPLCTIPNQALYTIYFTDCTFNSQPITNNLSAGNFSRLIFTNCSILPSLSLGNCVLNGLNASAVVSSLTAGSITLGGASTSFLKGNGSLDTTSYLPRTGGTMTGPIDMGTQNITNGGNFTANSFIRSGGSSSQFLKADGSIDSVSYPQLFTGTFTMTWDGGGGVSSTQTIYYTKIGSPLGVGMVTLRFNAFSVTIGGTSRASIVSSSPISAPGVSFTPNANQGFQLMAVPIRFNNAAVGLGWMEINTAGNLNIYGPQIGNYWTAGTTNCGLNNICSITYST
jgi:hypothetical protein